MPHTPGEPEMTTARRYTIWSRYAAKRCEGFADPSEVSFPSMRGGYISL